MDTDEPAPKGDCNRDTSLATVPDWLTASCGGRMPDGSPAPSLMTAAECLRFLRVDSSDPSQWVRNAERKRGLPTIRIARELVVPLAPLIHWYITLTEERCSRQGGRRGGSKSRFGMVHSPTGGQWTRRASPVTAGSQTPPQNDPNSTLIPNAVSG